MIAHGIDCKCGHLLQHDAVVQSVRTEGGGRGSGCHRIHPRHVAVAWQHVNMFGSFEFTDKAPDIDIAALAARYVDAVFWSNSLSALAGGKGLGDRGEYNAKKNDSAARDCVSGSVDAQHQKN